jgi:hypothetical protein
LQRTSPLRRSAAPSGPARSQFVMLGPGMRQVRALLPTDPAFDPVDVLPVPPESDSAPAAVSGVPSGVATPVDQDMGSVDSGREMRQA